MIDNSEVERDAARMRALAREQGIVPEVASDPQVSVSVGRTDDGLVALAFSAPVRNFAMPPAAARHLAENIRQASHKIERARKKSRR